MQFYLNASIYTQLVYTTFVLTDFNIFSVTVMLFVWFRRRAHQVLVSGTTRHTHCAVVVEVAATIFRRRHVLDAVILPSVCGNVSSWFVNIILLMLTALTYYNTMVILIYCDDTLLYQTFAYFLRLLLSLSWLTHTALCWQTFPADHRLHGFVVHMLCSFDWLVRSTDHAVLLADCTALLTDRITQ